MSHSPHDPESQETEVEFAGLNVLLSEGLAGGDEVDAGAGADRPGQGRAVQEAGHGRRALLDGEAREGTLLSVSQTGARLLLLLLLFGSGPRLLHWRGGARPGGGAVAVVGFSLPRLGLLGSFLGSRFLIGGHESIELLVVLGDCGGCGRGGRGVAGLQVGVHLVLGLLHLLAGLRLGQGVFELQIVLDVELFNPGEIVRPEEVDAVHGFLDGGPLHVSRGDTDLQQGKYDKYPGS